MVTEKKPYIFDAYFVRGACQVTVQPRGSDVSVIPEPLQAIVYDAYGYLDTYENPMVRKTREELIAEGATPEDLDGIECAFRKAVNA